MHGCAVIRKRRTYLFLVVIRHLKGTYSVVHILFSYDIIFIYKSGLERSERSSGVCFFSCCCCWTVTELFDDELRENKKKKY